MNERAIRIHVNAAKKSGGKRTGKRTRRARGSGFKILDDEDAAKRNGGQQIIKKERGLKNEREVHGGGRQRLHLAGDLADAAGDGWGAAAAAAVAFLETFRL